MNLNTSFKSYRKRTASLRREQSFDTSLSPKTLSSPDPPARVFKTNSSKYNVLYRKYTTKKNKTWEGDAVLSFNDQTNTAVIRNEDDIVIGKLKEADKTIFKGIFRCPGSGLEFELDDEIIHSKIPKLNLSKNNTTSITTFSKPSTFKSPLLISKDDDNNINKKNISTKSHGSIENKKTSISKDNTTLIKNNKLTNKIAPDAPLYDISNVEDPLYMPEPPPSIDESEKFRKVIVDPSISSKLRPHQREGVKFLYSCLMGLKSDDINGAILADEMGLGKTLQTIALIWTLLRQSPTVGSKPTVEKVLICCPVSLVNNWKNEFTKWLGLNRINVLTINNNKYQNEKQDIELFGKNKVYQVMIIGYEKMHSMSDLLVQIRFDLLVCDEGHRLKNSENKIMKTLESFNIRRRILLSGTPIQNDLVEFYTMANFTNPGILSDLKSFHKNFVKPILDSRDSNCNNLDLVKKGREKSRELVELTNNFILRRSNLELTKYLPKRSDYILLVPPTALQLQLFQTIVDTKKFKNFIDLDQEIESSSSNVSFSLINTFRKICNSPSLLKNDGFFLELCEKNSESSDDINFRNQLSKKVKSGKLLALIKILGILHSDGEEKAVVVSNFTSTLDIFESLFKSLNLSFLRLDGSTPSKERGNIVDKFNKSSPDKVFVLLLSAKAGGVGLNLVGASRLILYDNDWNPAVDLQAIARIHRDGQKKEVKIYRLLTNGCIDEKIFQRQLVKQDLSDRFVDQKGGEKELFDRVDLKDIFNVQFDKIKSKDYCNTHEIMCCDCRADGSIMIDGKYYNDSSSEDEYEEGEESSDLERKKEVMTFMSALSFSHKYPTDENDTDIVNTKRKKIRRCMKEYRHINPITSLSEGTQIDTDDTLLDTLINGQEEDNPLVSFVFGKF